MVAVQLGCSCVQKAIAKPSYSALQQPGRRRQQHSHLIHQLSMWLYRELHMHLSFPQLLQALETGLCEPDSCKAWVEALQERPYLCRPYTGEATRAYSSARQKVRRL